ncbi:MAG: serine/threonine-protein kinase [Myxococcota bacterium]
MSTDPPNDSEPESESSGADQPADLLRVEGLVPLPVAAAVDGGSEDEDEDEYSGGYGVEALPRGTQLGRYVLLGRVAGREGAVVYGAYDPEEDRKVLLKLFDPGGDDDDEDAAQAVRLELARQAQGVAKVSHPCVEQIHEVGVYDHWVFLATEFVDGLNVRQWMEVRDDPFPWPEVLRVFREAGRGLAAAHKQRIVHRDFRPSNVLMGKEGRLVVIDFGLAPEVEEEDDDIEVSALRESLSGAALEDTQPGPAGMAGTPAYMAPEQHLTGQADARSDQFSFCVAMYEALYGERPFSGNRPRAIALEAAKHKVRPAPPDSNVPAWLRAIVIRGLSPRPKDRFPTMEALLRELARDPSARRRRWLWGAAGAAGMMGVIGLTAWAFEADQNACDDTSSALAEVWTIERREALGEVFTATERQWAEPTWRYTESKLDAWSSVWADYSRLACQATRVWGDAAEKTYELRVACLDRHLTEFDATLEALAEVDGPMLDRAHALAQRLPDPRRCTDTSALFVLGQPPEDSREQIDGLHRQMAGLEARLVLGQAGAVSHEIGGLLPEADATENDALIARGHLLRGRAELAKGNPEAEALLHGAAQEALRAGDTSLAAIAWRGRVDALLQRDRAAEAGALVDYIDAVMANKRFEWLRPDLAIARGRAELAQGRSAEALGHFYAAIELEEGRNDADPLRLLPAWLGQAEVLDAHEDTQEAIAPIKTALDVTRNTLGPQHPAAVELLQRLGQLQQREGLLTDARPNLEQALEITRMAGNGDPGRIAELETSLGRILQTEGDVASAAIHFERAYELVQGKTPTGASFRAGLRVARARLELRRKAEARTLLAQLLTTYPPGAPIGRDGPTSFELAQAELLLATLVWDDGEAERARELATRSIARPGESLEQGIHRDEAQRWLEEHPAP